MSDHCKRWKRNNSPPEFVLYMKWTQCLDKEGFVQLGNAKILLMLASISCGYLGDGTDREPTATAVPPLRLGLRIN